MSERALCSATAKAVVIDGSSSESSGSTYVRLQPECIGLQAGMYRVAGSLSGGGGHTHLSAHAPPQPLTNRVKDGAQLPPGLLS